MHASKLIKPDAASFKASLSNPLERRATCLQLVVALLINLDAVISPLTSEIFRLPGTFDCFNYAHACVRFFYRLMEEMEVLTYLYG